jgi:hypothetical protein
MSRLLTLVLGALIGSAATLALAAGQDAVKVSPQLYKVRLENDRVRVLEYRMAPGGVEPRHDHPPYVVYFLGDAFVRSTAADGTRSETKVARGDVGWRDNTTHTIENAGTTDIHALIIEPKR